MIIPAKEYYETWRNGIYTIEQIMIEFAKFHVKAALEAATENAKVVRVENTGFAGSHQGYCLIVDKESTLNAYPLSNIK